MIAFSGLHLAAHFGLYDICHGLINRFEGIDVNSRLSGKTPLEIAVERKNDHIVYRLLEMDNINVESKDNSGRTALSHAAANGNLDALRLLLEKEAEVSSYDEDEFRTPLSYAAIFGHEEAVHLLLEHGANTY